MAVQFGQGSFVPVAVGFVDQHKAAMLVPVPRSRGDHPVELPLTAALIHQIKYTERRVTRAESEREKYPLFVHDAKRSRVDLCDWCLPASLYPTRDAGVERWHLVDAAWTETKWPVGHCLQVSSQNVNAGLTSPH